MVEKENKLSYNIKGKLISAIAMLLVAVIMVVSSTYAWFTLSTAPEVTSISTAVGANGALEMLLLTRDGAEWVYNDGIVDADEDENTYWGNLVDLSDNSKYGTNLITLNPSVLNITDEGKINSVVPVSIPDYNEGGRVTATKGAGQFGILSDTGTSFVPVGPDDYGFRALGVASGLTERQQAFRTALGEIATAQGSALTNARNSLSANGNTLAAIAVKKAMNDDAEFTANDITTIGNMIDALETALKKVEDAYIQAVVAAILSSDNSAEDTAANAAAATIKAYLDDSEGNSAVGTRLQAALTDEAFADLGDTVKTAVNALPGYTIYTGAVSKFNAAKTAYEAIAEKTEYVWGDFSSALTNLVNVENITVNGVTVSELKTDEGKNQVAADVMGGKGVSVNIPSGGGVYADIADLCEDYTVDIVINSTDLNVGLRDMLIKAKMKADSTGDAKYLNKLRDAINDKSPTSQGAADQPLTEFYGYVIDLAFKTNAAQSNLLLQYDAKDRIYTDNNNEATMGGGSTMTFASTSNNFTNDQVESLMSNIRVVFFNTDDYSVIAKAKLDTANASADSNGVTAQIKIVGDDENIVSEQSDAVITSLDQHVIKRVSVLVYLDGEDLKNEDVAATEEVSLTGTVNIQFASSANLVPMEYGDLHTPNASSSSAAPEVSE